MSGSPGSASKARRTRRHDLVDDDCLDDVGRVTASARSYDLDDDVPLAKVFRCFGVTAALESSIGTVAPTSFSQSQYGTALSAAAACIFRSRIKSLPLVRKYHNPFTFSSTTRFHSARRPPFTAPIHSTPFTTHTAESIMVSTPNFLTIPVEMQENAMAFVSDKDLLSVRLTCAEFVVASKRAFDMAFFTSRSWLVTSKDLRLQHEYHDSHTFQGRIYKALDEDAVSSRY